MLNNQDFTHNRAGFLGGSDIGAIVGVSKYRSAIDVLLEKTGKRVDTKDSLALRFGSFAEDFIASEYTRHIDLPVVAHADPILHRDHGYLAGHIDRFVLPSSDINFLMMQESSKPPNSWSAKRQMALPSMNGVNQEPMPYHYPICANACGT